MLFWRAFPTTSNRDKERTVADHSSRFSNIEKTSHSVAIAVEPEAGAAAEVETALMLLKVDTEAAVRVTVKADVEAEEVVVVHREDVEERAVVEDVVEDSRTIRRLHPPTQHRHQRLRTLNLSSFLNSIFPCVPPKSHLLVHLLNGHVVN